MRDSLFSYAALAVSSGVIGYWIGVGSSLNVSRSPRPASNEQESEEGSESEGELEAMGLDKVKADTMEECKMVLVVRGDLGMTKGKMAAQCGHATLACYKTLLKSNPGLLKHWERIGQAKIALRCDGEEELMLLQAQAQSLGICARTIQDAGRTQIAAGSTTVFRHWSRTTEAR